MASAPPPHGQRWAFRGEGILPSHAPQGAVLHMPVRRSARLSARGRAECPPPEGPDSEPNHRSINMLRDLLHGEGRQNAVPQWPVLFSRQISSILNRHRVRCLHVNLQRCSADRSHAKVEAAGVGQGVDASRHMRILVADVEHLDPMPSRHDAVAGGYLETRRPRPETFALWLVANAGLPASASPTPCPSPCPPTSPARARRCVRCR